MSLSLCSYALLFFSYCSFALLFFFFFFFFNDTATTEIYTLSLHDALPIYPWDLERVPGGSSGGAGAAVASGMCRLARSEEHTSELQSHLNLVCRLLLEKKKKEKDKTRNG